MQLDNALSQHLRQIVTLPLTTLACTVPDTLACPRYLTLPYTLHIGGLGAEAECLFTGTEKVFSSAHFRACAACFVATACTALGWSGFEGRVTVGGITFPPRTQWP